jgi:hypothetical protein
MWNILEMDGVAIRNSTAAMTRLQTRDSRTLRMRLAA